MVRRITADEAEAYMDAPVYGVATMNDHDPFGVRETSLEPKEMGIDLGMSMADWLAASGQAVYTISGNQAELDLTLENLVPNGLYTLWCSTISTPPNFHIVNIPCGDPYGGDNVFTADDQGNAHAHVALNTMPDAREDLIPLIAVAYHSDGLTYDEYPGSFGLNAHVQTFAPSPQPTTRLG